jgi:hypothetical protein
VVEDGRGAGEDGERRGDVQQYSGVTPVAQRQRYASGGEGEAQHRRSRAQSGIPRRASDERLKIAIRRVSACSLVVHGSPGEALDAL